MGRMPDYYTEFNSLAKAIVEQAVVDYRYSLEYMKLHKNDDFTDKRTETAYRKMCQMRIDCERFLRGRWYQQLTDLDGERVVKTVRTQVRRGIKVDRIQRGGRSDGLRVLQVD